MSNTKYEPTVGDVLRLHKPEEAFSDCVIETLDEAADAAHLIRPYVIMVEGKLETRTERWTSPIGNLSRNYTLVRKYPG